MSDTEPNQKNIDETEAAIAELAREFDRVGVDPKAIGEAFRLIADESARDQRGPEDDTIGIDVFMTLPIIRSLPDSAGTNAFLIAFGLPRQSAP